MATPSPRAPGRIRRAQEDLAEAPGREHGRAREETPDPPGRLLEHVGPRAGRRVVDREAVGAVVLRGQQVDRGVAGEEGDVAVRLELAHERFADRLPGRVGGVHDPRQGVAALEPEGQIPRGRPVEGDAELLDQEPVDEAGAFPREDLDRGRAAQTRPRPMDVLGEPLRGVPGTAIDDPALRVPGVRFPRRRGAGDSTTDTPASASSRATVPPAMPQPTTRTSLSTVSFTPPSARSRASAGPSAAPGRGSPRGSRSASA